jgi:UDP-glucose 4-epimerase
MKILVTGGAGFIGSHLVDALINQGHSVTVVDNLSHGNEKNVNPKANLYNLDICSESLASVFKEYRPEIVFHHAAQTSVNHSMLHPSDDAKTNILGSINLFQYCVKSGVRQVILASTGGALYGNPRYLPCDEEHVINPLSPYGLSKYTIERYLYLFNLNNNLNYSILRYSNVYGPRQDALGEAGVIAIFANRMCKGENVFINGSGQQERDFIYVGDVVRANIAVIGHGEGRIYNLGSGSSISIYQLFQIMQKLIDYRLEPIYRPALPGEVLKIYLSTERIKKELGWVPKTTFSEGLKATIDYYNNISLLTSC